MYGSAPRAWGRLQEPPLTTCVGVGSAPRAWGRLGVSDGAELDVRLSPTCVGTTAKQSAPPRGPSGSAPRAWGRREMRLDAGESLFGSAPRAWGRRSAYPVVASRGTAQPHVRGDDLHGRQARRRSLRLSPTCVGTTNKRIGHDALIERLSPTCVGTTRYQRDDASRYRLSPTCVGTTNHNGSRRSSRLGSAPRAWGRPSVPRARPKLFVGSAPRAWGRPLPPVASC